MFKCLKFRKDIRTERYATFERMKKAASDKQEWSALKEQYEMYDKMENPGGHISKDILVSIAGSLLMTVLVLRFEKFDIITSKMFSWVKPRKF